MQPHSQLTTPSTGLRAAGRPRPLVLLVDPNETTRSVLEVSLGRDGFDVVSATSSIKALELARRRVPEIVVVEAELGDEDGFTFVATLRGDSLLKRVPVLLLAKAGERDWEGLAEVVGIDVCIQKPAFARDVVALVRIEHARRNGAQDLSFDAAQLAPAQLVRALLSTSRSGRLTLAGGHASVAFRQGQVMDVVVDAQRGDLDGLVRALALTTGDYSLRLAPVDGSAALKCGLRELVTMVMPRLAKFSEVQLRSVPLDARLVVDFRRLGATLSALPDGINAVLQLFDGHRSVREVLIDSPINETLSLELTTRLVLMKVLTQAPKAEALPPLTPHLFEPEPTEARELLREVFAGGEVRVETQQALVSSEDWFEEPHGTGLDLVEPSGGWTALAPAQGSFDLSGEVQHRLEAFGTKVEVEGHEVPKSAKDLGQFVRQGIGEGPAADSLEAALLLAVPTLAPVESGLRSGESQPKPEPEGELQVRAGADDAVITPLLTPAVDPSVALEAAFFARAARAEAEAEAAVEGDAVPVKAARRVRPWVSLVLAVVAIAVVVEVLVQGAEEAEVSPVTVAPPLIAPPAPPPIVEPVVLVAPPVVEEAPPPVEVLDISENLREARLAYEAGLYTKAAAVLDQSLGDAPGSTEAWMLLGQVRYDSRDPLGARAAALRLLEIDPLNARVQMLLAAVAYDLGDRTAAHQALNRYLELEPNGPYAREALALLKR